MRQTLLYNLIKNLKVKSVRIILGFIIVSLYIGINYLRERVPRDVPFTLSFLTLVILVVVCSSYILIIKNLIKPSKISLIQKVPPSILDWIKNIILFLYKPLLALDNFIKEGFTHNCKIKFVKIFARIFDNFYSYSGKVGLCILVFLWPRLILVTLLSFDIFCFHKVNIFYNYILLAIIPLIVRYILNLLLYFKENLLQHLEAIYGQVGFFRIENEKHHNDNDYWMYYTNEDSYAELKEFIERQTNAIHWNDICFRHYPYPHGRIYEQFRKDHPHLHNIELTNLHYNTMGKSFYDIMPIIIDVNVFFVKYDTIIKSDWHYKYLLISINILYLICWAYILFLTLYTIPVESFACLAKIPDIVPNDNPFI